MLLEANDLQKTFHRGGQRVEALRGVSIQIDSGQFVSIMGPSGSGKSTLLHCLGGLDRPTRGKILIRGKAIDEFSDRDLSVFRRTELGFIFQFFNLIPTLSALENVMLPLLLDRVRASEILPRARELLAEIGLKDREEHRPNQLSGGEMQRVAIARAFIAKPALVLADEPTGNLDSKTGTAILELLRKMVDRHGNTVVMVTHDLKAASFGERIITMRDGLVESDQKGSRV